ncbi:MAG: HD domain-containing protein [Syntrophomonadaceae bacterium]|nr:HD domain-containing protein [Syntrophomonadaceae bacterium]
MERKGPYLVKELKTLQPGVQIWGKYLILEKVQRKTKDGREVINLTVCDSTGDIDAVIWDNCSISGNLQTGLVVGVLGDLGSYNNRLQITAKRVKILEENPDQYIKKPDLDIEKLWFKLNQLIESVSDAYMKELLTRVFSGLNNQFGYAPAAKKIHHNYAGGLLEHTIAVANLLDKTAGLYPDTNRDLIITGALLHDIGKVVEYEIKLVPEYTVEGRLLGHIMLGAEIVGRHIEQMKKDGVDFPAKLEWMIKHMILSHHGSLEYGSPVIPVFPEAFLLHIMDNLDARMFVFKEKMAEYSGEDDLFSYDSLFHQYFFKYRYGE